MANPRGVAFTDAMEGDVLTFIIDNSTITYDVTKTNGSAAVGKAVTMSAAKTVKLAADGEAVIGKLVKVESDNKCAVQCQGVVILPGGNGATLTLGKRIVGAADSGGNPGFIREVATATAAELGVARGAILDAGTATAVAVLL